jgi:thioesterase domain-containing protein
VDCYELEQYLHEHIPLSRAMGVEVIESGEEQVKLSAPLAPNINHRETVFGGSASAVAILAGWSLLYVRLQKAGIRSRIVIQRNTVNYERPIPGEFTAQSSVHDPAEWDRFVNTLKRKHRARISVTVELHCNGNKVGELQGDFVALGAPPA